MSAQVGAATVLIVGHSLVHLGLLMDRLEETGWLVLVAQDGEEALDRVQYVLPDLVLLEVRMPGMDGHETCRRLKSDPRMMEVPVIFIGAQHDPYENLRSFEVGGVDCITAPLNVAETIARMQVHLAIYLRLKRLAEECAGLRRWISLNQKKADSP